MRETRWLVAAAVTCALELMSTPQASAQQSTPLLGGIIKIPGYYSGQPVVPPGATPIIPTTPNGSPGWFTRWNYPSFQKVPLTPATTSYSPHYIPIHHRHKLYLYEDEE